jgi:methylenetetrahydrofolate reductase (NADH)
MADTLNVIDHLNNAKSTIFSLELLPPIKGQDISKIYNTLDPLIEFDPKYINITTHRDEVQYKDMGDGIIRKQTVRKRPGSVAIAAAVHNKYKLTVVPHIICSGFTKEETEHVLIDLNFLGINNLILLRGDPLKTDPVFKPEPGGHTHTTDIIEQVNDLNKGIFLDKEVESKSNFDFHYGVAGYPEKHGEAPNMDSDIFYLKKKVEMGAEYIVTQMFFDNQKYFDFVKLCRENDINVPIIPGIKPLALLNQITVLPKIFNIDMPEDFAKEVRKCKTNKDAGEVGVEWCILQCKELVQHNVPVLHMYTMGAGKNIYKVAKAVF